jgi:hypothetical protein
MSVVGDIFGVGGVATLVNTVVGKIWPDTTAQDMAKLDLLKAELTGELQQTLGQLEINKAEAASADPFTSRWRPFVGWVCGVALAYQFIGYPFLVYLSAVAGVNIGTLPVLNYDALSTILMGMLGLGGMRSLEKIKGVTK